ncbi:DDE_Tnp_1_7 domain-containing protein [Trichonephila clavipes]|nr:DDE_Tnp_1_7 domain-containing protein [Trichonephila clavipes]
MSGKKKLSLQETLELLKSLPSESSASATVDSSDEVRANNVLEFSSDSEEAEEEIEQDPGCSSYIQKIQHFLLQDAFTPKKPIKRGFTLLCRADWWGYMYQFDFYQEHQTDTDKSKKESGQGDKVVDEMTKKLCVSNDRSGLPKLIDDKRMKRGDFDYQISNQGVCIFKRKDNQPVYFFCNYHGHDTCVVERKLKDVPKIDVTALDSLEKKRMVPSRRFQRPYKQLNDLERGRIVGMREAEWSYRAIGIHLQLTGSAVQRC